jgi:16S rRNA (adenine1518-N6/adenine1519-N6)-dimethyltransferase
MTEAEAIPSAAASLTASAVAPSTTPSDGEPLILDARTLLDRHGIRAKKSWGQNFLVDERAYRNIVAACQLSVGDIAVEIGAGLGTLTSRLLATGATVVAVERERDMCAVLQAELGGRPRFRLCEANALTIDLPTLVADLPPAPSGKLVVVGNLPYQISSPLIFRFLEQRSVVRTLVVMLQREVAARLVAAVGSDDYSALSAQAPMLARIEPICHVGRRGFIPAPNVESSVVRLTPFATSRVPVRDLKQYAAVVRAGFSQRRKTLRNALGAHFDERAMAGLAAAGIDLNRRGETLSVAEFATLADALPSD